MSDPTQEKKTLVIGASPRSYRYSHMAVSRLRAHGHPVVALGHHEGNIGDVPIHTQKADWADLHTVTLYVNPQHQQEYARWLTELKPARVIFNPGAENPALERQLKDVGIEVLRACTLVMLSTGQY